jgi:hypothetical protein
MIEYNIIKCPHCPWMMRIPLENKMTNLEDSLKIHLNFSHKK